MATLQFVTTLFSGPLGAGARVTDMLVNVSPAGTTLVAGAQPGSGMMTFALQPGQAASLTATTAYSPLSDTIGPTRLDLMQVGSQTILLASGRFGPELGGNILTSSGSFGGSRSYPDGAGVAGDLTELEVVRIGGDSWIYGSTPAGGGVMSWKIAAGTTTLTPQATYPDDAYSYADGINAMTSASVNGTQMVFVASAAENGVTALRVNGDGSLTRTGAIAAQDGLGIDTPTAMEVVTIGPASYLLLASAGSSTLTSLRIDPTGLIPVDQVADSLTTRFQAVEAIETVSIAGRTYVIAGGGDDGLSVFRMLPDGRLILDTTLDDTNGTALANVSAIEAVTVGGEVQVFVTSGAEDGLTQFTLRTGPVGVTLTGDAQGNALTGGALDDILMGGGGADTLSGAAGDDILVDGAGADTLTGGAGADLFVLLTDGATDRITDFDPRFDRIDLSDYALLYDVSQLTVTPTTTGAFLTYGTETVEIVTAGFTTLLAVRLHKFQHAEPAALSGADHPERTDRSGHRCR